MRRLLFAAALLASSAGSLSPQGLRPPQAIPAADVNFRAQVGKGLVTLTWNRYRNPDFAEYHVVKAQNAQPSYPRDAAIFSSNDAGDTRFEDGQLVAGAWRYRLTIVTRFGDRWESPVASVSIRPQDLERRGPTAADFEL